MLFNPELMSSVSLIERPGIVDAKSVMSLVKMARYDVLSSSGFSSLLFAEADSRGSEVQKIEYLVETITPFLRITSAAMGADPNAIRYLPFANSFEKEEVFEQVMQLFRDCSQFQDLSLKLETNSGKEDYWETHYQLSKIIGSPLMEEDRGVLRNQPRIYEDDSRTELQHRRLLPMVLPFRTAAAIQVLKDTRMLPAFGRSNMADMYSRVRVLGANTVCDTQGEREEVARAVEMAINSGWPTVSG